MNAQQMVASLLPIRDADAGSACMKCMKGDARLVRCAACRSVRYCNKGCQTSDWTTHKPVCKIMRSFRTVAVQMADNSMAAAFGAAAAGLCRGKAAAKNKFDRFRASPPNDLPRNITEDAWSRAAMLVMRSPMCSICQKTDYDYNAEETEWRCCPTCKNGWCCAEHYDEYMARRHTQEICDKYIRATKIDRFRYNHTVMQGDRFMTVPEQALSEPLESFPTNWHEYFQLRMLSEYGMRNRLPDEYFPSATFLLSQVTTCLYGMYQHDREFFTNAPQLTIHVVGANAAFECEGGSPTCVWEEIMHCLPSVETMNVIFIGPEVNITLALRDYGSCPDCEAKGRRRMMAFHELTYHDYYASGEFLEPDFVVAFNTGMYEEYTESWKTSLEVILSLNVPSIFTSYNRHEGESDFEVLGEVNARTLTEAPVYNPFRVKIPLVDDGCIDKFFQCNMYCTCFRGRRGD